MDFSLSPFLCSPAGCRAAWTCRSVLSMTAAATRTAMQMTARQRPVWTHLSPLWYKLIHKPLLQKYSYPLSVFTYCDITTQNIHVFYWDIQHDTQCCIIIRWKENYTSATICCIKKIRALLSQYFIELCNLLDVQLNSEPIFKSFAAS